MLRRMAGWPKWALAAPAGFELSKCGRFLEWVISEEDAKRVVNRIVNKEGALPTTNGSESLVLSFLVIHYQTRGPIEDLPKNLSLVVFSSGAMEFRADGVRFPISDKVMSLKG